MYERKLRARNIICAPILLFIAIACLVGCAAQHDVAFSTTAEEKKKRPPFPPGQPTPTPTPTVTPTPTPTPPPTGTLVARSTSLAANHDYNRAVTYTVDVKTLSGVGSDTTVTVAINSVTGTLNGGIATVVSDRIQYTTGPLQDNNQDIVINYRLQRGTETSSAVINVDVTCLPDCITPRAENASANIVIPTTGPVPVTIPLNIAGGVITITALPTKGTATVSGNSVVFTPNANATAGTDTIRYRVDKKLNGVTIASSADATVSLTVELEQQCPDFCDGRPNSIDISFTPPTRNTDGSAIPEGTISGYGIFIEKQDTTEQQPLGVVPHTGPLSQTQTARFNIDYTRFSNPAAMRAVCVRATARNNLNIESAKTNPACRSW